MQIENKKQESKYSPFFIFIDKYKNKCYSLFIKKVIIIYHYKERQPKDTIQIIEQFFNNKGLQLKLAYSGKTEINTWTCSYQLLQNNRIIQTANGKGITEELSIASCYAEMYERFCMNVYSTPWNPIIVNDVINNNKFYKFNFKQLTWQEIIQDIYCYKLLERLLPEMNEEYINQFLKLYYGNNYLGIPYYNLNDKTDITYKHMKLINSAISSHGFAAGNTLEEALIQGSCELYERQGLQSFYYNEIKQFYQINVNSLNKYYQNIIKNLNQKDIDVFIYDLSYNLNIPVCFINFIDKNTHNFYFQFGSAPIFDIALERCFTEFYQGDLNFPKLFQETHRVQDCQANYIVYDMCTSTRNKESIIIDNLILNSIMVNNYNKKIFLENNNQSIDILLNHIKQININNKIDFYYSDISLCNSIKTIHIIQSQYIQQNFIEERFNIHLYDKQTQKLLFNLTSKIHIYYQQLIRNNSCISIEELGNKLKEILQTLTQFNTKTIYERFQMLFTCLGANYYIFILKSGKEKTIPTVYYMMNDILQNNNLQGYQIDEMKIYTIYKSIEEYLKDNYSKEKIKQILDWLHYDDIELDFKLEDMTPLWYINKIFIEPLYAKYHSQEYYAFINIFGSDETMIEMNNKEVLEDSN